MTESARQGKGGGGAAALERPFDIFMYLRYVDSQ